ncbi:hypothetical protein NC653_023492 [Populus alba x Populus x berolinensis]|uniref:Uncharacterized protein n=1 Tax=Populus alba x Populus x berolinensis TaxID=444605 RepID=A0AAD6MIV2_9ROSI|nr:hypothetical protein NC653_023492 [Populus alba x Populus x berolinensis]
MLYFPALLFRAPVNFQFSVVEMVDQDLISPGELKWCCLCSLTVATATRIKHEWAPSLD